jgi:hypothetical protein
MPLVKVLSIYLGKSPAAKHASPAPTLNLSDDGFLCQQFRRSLLDAQGASERFKVKVEIPELPPLDVEWSWADQTAGIAFWQRGGRIGAASILLNGTECDQENEMFAAAFLAHQLPVPQRVWKAIANEPKPMIATLFYNLYSFTDPVIATAAPALANAFFTLFGTSGVTGRAKTGQRGAFKTSQCFDASYTSSVSFFATFA